MGDIVGSIDLTQVVLYVFFVFFAGLVYYLHQEDKREGYPLESDRSASIKVVGYPPMPAPKTFRLAHGGPVQAPLPDGGADRRPIAAEATAKWPGAPLAPTGNPLLAAVGPGSFAARRDEAELTIDNQLVIVPLRSDPATTVAKEDADPRGMTVIGADGKAAGTVTDLWVDRPEALIRYLEVAGPGGPVLLPINFTRIDGRRRQVRVNAILAKQFADVPKLRQPGQVTKLEEDRIAAYYGGGLLYATPDRAEPWL